MGRIIPYILEKKHVPNHQPVVQLQLEYWATEDRLGLDWNDGDFVPFLSEIVM